MLPGSWGSLQHLRQLDLSNNQLTGAIPPSWSGMTALQELSIQNNCGLCGGAVRLPNTLTRLLSDGTNMALVCGSFICDPPFVSNTLVGLLIAIACLFLFVVQRQVLAVMHAGRHRRQQQEQQLAEQHRQQRMADIPCYEVCVPGESMQPQNPTKVRAKQHLHHYAW